MLKKKKGRLEEEKVLWEGLQSEDVVSGLTHTQVVQVKGRYNQESS
jgi:hypothetical protein